MSDSWRHIKAYLSGLVKGPSAHQLERDALDDPFLSDALDGFEAFDPEQLDSDIQTLQDRLNRRTRKAIYWPSIAAVVAMILTIGAIWMLWPQDPAGLSHKEAASEVALDKDEEIPNVMSDSLGVDKPAPSIAMLEEHHRAGDEQIIGNEQAPTFRSQLKKEVPKEAIQAKAPVAQEEKEIIREDQELAAVASGQQMAEADQMLQEQVAEAPVNEPAVAFDDSYFEKEEADMPDELVIQEGKTRKKKAITGAKVEIDDVKMISGRVLSMEDEQPLPGVSVYVKGTNRGAVTDVDGAFKISIPEEVEAPVLSINFIGMVSEEVDVQSDVDYVEVTMEQDVQALSEVVVTGYGTEKKTADETIQSGPQPVGGFKVLRQYIKAHQQLPENWEGDKATVKLKIRVGKKGDIKNIEVEESPSKALAKEAIRLVQNGPEWEPGTVGEEPQEMVVTFKVRFKR